MATEKRPDRLIPLPIEQCPKTCPCRSADSTKPTDRRPDVPDELLSTAIDVWHAACHADRTVLEAMTAVLEAVLPARDAMVLGPIAERIRDALYDLEGGTARSVEAAEEKLNALVEELEGSRGKR